MFLCYCLFCLTLWSSLFVWYCAGVTWVSLQFTSMSCIWEIALFYAIDRCAAFGWCVQEMNSVYIDQSMRSVCCWGIFFPPCCVIQLLTPTCHFLIISCSHLTAGFVLIQRVFLFPENALFLKVFGSRRWRINDLVAVYDVALTLQSLTNFGHLLQASLTKKSHLVFWKQCSNCVVCSICLIWVCVGCFLFCLYSCVRDLSIRSLSFLCHLEASVNIWLCDFKQTHIVTSTNIKIWICFNMKVSLSVSFSSSTYSLGLRGVELVSWGRWSSSLFWWWPSTPVCLVFQTISTIPLMCSLDLYKEHW